MTTHSIAFTVVGQHITLPAQITPPVADTRQYLRAVFSFDAAWDGLRRLAVFTGLGAGVNTIARVSYTVELDEDNACCFPAEAITSDNCLVQVGVIGYGEGDYRLTTDTCAVRQQKSCFREGKTPPPPSPDVYASMLETLATAQAAADTAATTARRLEADAAGGRFDGAPGQDGPPGQDGTPGLTPYIGENGQWHIGDTDTGVPATGPQGLSGLMPLRDLGIPTNTVLRIPPNTMTVITAAGSAKTVALVDGPDGYDNEWGLTVTMGTSAVTVKLPSVKWPLGIAPTFAASTTTICRFYYVGETLCGEWVTA